METRAPKLFVGVGNVLRGDDGLGVRAAEIMLGLPLPPEVEVYEAGTSLPDLGSVLESRDRVVVMDAIDAKAKPGAVFRLRAEALRRRQQVPISLHEIDLLYALDEARLLNRAPRDVVIVAVQVADLSRALTLSIPVEGALLGALGVAIHELGLPLDILDYLLLAHEAEEVVDGNFHELHMGLHKPRRGAPWS